MLRISLKHFCLNRFLAKQMGDETLSFGHKKCLRALKKQLLLVWLLFYKHCIVCAVSTIAAAFLCSLSDVRLFLGFALNETKEDTASACSIVALKKSKCAESDSHR